MKKKILFIMGSLTCGGAEKSLISLLETIDYSRYEVDLYLFRHSGLFLKQIPVQVNLLPEPQAYQYFDMSIKLALIKMIKLRRFGLAARRIIAGYLFRAEKIPAIREQRTWKHVSYSLPLLSKQYDVAIGYLEKNPIYFAIDKAKATKKIGVIHTEYDKLGMDPKLDRKYFDRLDHLITVSDECGRVLENRFPDLKSKVRIIHNIVSPEVIHKLAMESIGDDRKSEFRIVSTGRLIELKGFDMAIEACRRLVDSGYNLKWYVIGEGDERSKLEHSIRDKGLENIFILMGLKENPYPHIKQADIYVQPSRFEGKSIAIDEAKILHKPIVVTNFSTASDQIESGKNGLIVEMNAQALSDGIKQLLDNVQLRNQFAERLAGERLGTESEIEKLYELF